MKSVQYSVQCSVWCTVYSIDCTMYNAGWVLPGAALPGGLQGPGWRTLHTGDTAGGAGLSAL